MKIYITTAESEDERPTVVNGSWTEILHEAAKHGTAVVTVEKYSRAKTISNQMTRWFKGVLLPALADDTGDSIAKWETMLKLNVDPDYFKPFVVEVNGMAVTILPSIKDMPMKRAIALVDGSVAHLHDKTIYGDKFLWVTLPDPKLRKGYNEEDESERETE